MPTITKKELDEIKSRIIQQIDYRFLPPSEKNRYIPYNPGTGDEALEKLIGLINSNMMLPILMQPVMEILSKIPDPNPVQMLANLMKPINEVVKTLDSIKSLQDVPVIGELAKPVVDLVNSLLEIFGGIIGLLFLIGRGTPVFFDNLGHSVDIVKKWYNDNPDSSESIMSAYAAVDWDELLLENPFAEELVKVLRPKIIQPLDTIAQTISTVIAAWNVIEASGATYEAQIKNWEKVLKFLGVNTKALKIPTEEESARKYAPVMDVVTEWNAKLENMLSPKYILKEDNERLQQLRLQREAEKKAKEEAAKKAKEEAGKTAKQTTRS